MKKFLLLALLTFSSHWVAACVSCNKQIQDGIYNSQFYPNLITMFSAFIVLGILVSILTYISAKRYKAKAATYPANNLLTPVPLTTASIVLGIGLGGFIDGIVLHQILQWHEMLSFRIPTTNLIGKSVNMFWDGIFHGFCLLVVITGVILIWKLLYRNDINRSGKLLAGGLLLGWGCFNIVEGIINHHILKLHNVMESAPDHELANFAFLGVSVIMIVSGAILCKGTNQIPIPKIS